MTCYLCLHTAVVQRRTAAISRCVCARTPHQSAASYLSVIACCERPQLERVAWKPWSRCVSRTSPSSICVLRALVATRTQSTSTNTVPELVVTPPPCVPITHEGSIALEITSLRELSTYRTVSSRLLHSSTICRSSISSAAWRCRSSTRPAGGSAMPVASTFCTTRW